jgi:hypothetical protein
VRAALTVVVLLAGCGSRGGTRGGMRADAGRPVTDGASPIDAPAPMDSGGPAGAHARFTVTGAGLDGARSFAPPDNHVRCERGGSGDVFVRAAVSAGASGDEDVEHLDVDLFPPIEPGAFTPTTFTGGAPPPRSFDVWYHPTGSTPAWTNTTASTPCTLEITAASGGVLALALDCAGLEEAGGTPGSVRVTGDVACALP